MRRLITILVLLAAIYYAYDYFVVKGGSFPVALPERKPLRQFDGPTEVTGQPGRGLNPFVIDEPSSSAPQRPRVPAIPGSSN